MTDAATPEASPPADIPRRLDAARQDLLELSTRNRLLSTPRHAKRARALEVVDEKSDELYRLLIEGGASLTFLEASEETLAQKVQEAEAELARQAEPVAEPSADASVDGAAPGVEPGSAGDVLRGPESDPDPPMRRCWSSRRRTRRNWIPSWIPTRCRSITAT